MINFLPLLIVACLGGLIICVPLILMANNFLGRLGSTPED